MSATRGDLQEDLAQFLLAVLPERGPVIEIEGNARAVCLGRAGKFQAEGARLGRQCRDESRQVHDLHALAAEDPLQVEVLHVQRPADFAGAIVVHDRAARPVAAVGEIELVTIAPRPALLDLLPLVVHVPARQIVLDEARDRAVLDERRQHFHPQPKIGRNAGHIGLRAGGLHRKRVAAMHRLAHGRSEPHSHTGGHEQGEGTILPKFKAHGNLLVILSTDCPFK